MHHALRLICLLTFFRVQVVHADCAADLAALKTWHQTLSQEGPGAPIALLALPSSAGPSLAKKYKEEGPGLQSPLWVNLDEGIQSGVVVKNAELRARLSSNLEEGRGFLEATSPGTPYSPALPVAFSAQTPWRTVVAVLTAAEASGNERVLLLFAGSTALKTPPAAPNTAIAQNPGDWTGWSQGFDRCPQLSSIVRVDGWPQDIRGEWLISAWSDCKCPLPLVHLQNWLWGYMGRFQSAPVVERLLEWKPRMPRTLEDARAQKKPRKGPRPSLELPASMTWAEAWKKLEPLLDRAPTLKVRD